MYRYNEGRDKGPFDSDAGGWFFPTKDICRRVDEYYMLKARKKANSGIS